MEDAQEIQEWLDIINQSFSRNWKEQDYTRNIVEHKVYNVTHTYFLMDSERSVGVVSEAVFRKNPNIGVIHYLGLRKEFLGRGLGKHLVLYTLHQMKEHGVGSCEAETKLEYKKSLFIHFDWGFRPKTKLDYWNTPDHSPALTRAATAYKFRKVHEEWTRNRSSTDA